MTSIPSLVNLANVCGRPWARHPWRKLVDALGPGVSTKARHRGHGQGPWDDISGAVKRRRRQTDLLLILLRMLLCPIHLSFVSAKYNLCIGVIGLTSIGHKKRDDIILKHSQCPSCHHELLSAYHHGTQLETAVKPGCICW